MNYLKTFIGAVLAGMAIAIGGLAFLSVDSKVLGSALFTVGLFTVCTMGLNLFTGKVCYVFQNDRDYALALPVIWIGNLAGTGLIALFAGLTRNAPALAEKAAGMCQVKLDDNLVSLFFLGILCNILIYIGVEGYKNIPHEIGKYLAEYGLNFDFAPCADLSLDSKKVSAGNFSSDAGVASNMVSAEIEGLHASGIMAAVSHFPGYGDNTADNDNFIYNGSLWETILERDAVPFVDSLSKTDMLVIGHVELPAVTDDGFPASMSQQFIQEKVRDELGYKGVIMTDSMAAKSVKKNFVQSECAVEAVIAGADIVLTPYDLDKAYRSVLKAAEDGKIDESRINGSVRRILALKAKSGLLDDHKISEE